jgi:hypothetical protein
MVLKKDKKKVVGEFFDDERIRTFLDVQPPQGVDPDFHALERAYRGMQPENFATFVRFFTEAGHNLQATNPAGQTLEDIIRDHVSSTEYLQALHEAAN